VYRTQDNGAPGSTDVEMPQAPANQSASHEQEMLRLEQIEPAPPAPSAAAVKPPVGEKKSPRSRLRKLLSLGTLPPSRLKNASGLFNLTRNLGGAVGLAGLNTVLNKRVDLHLARLHDSITWSRRPAVEMLNNLAARIPTSDAQNMALKQLFMFTRQQGIVMAFADVFMLLAVMFATFAALVWLLRRPPPVTAEIDAH
jgi:hypothetical protein